MEENEGMDSIIPTVPLGDWVADGVSYLTGNFRDFFRALSDLLRQPVEALVDLLLTPPAVVMILILAVLGLLLRSWQFAIGSAITLFLVAGMGMWVPAMQTLALVLIATIIAVLIAVPIGILAARNRAVSSLVRPVLDFMQTMPAFVYLIPTVILFGIGIVPGLISTIIFALPPGVRLTELGIRQVDAETVEAGQSFGATGGQVLRGIQLPLAVPTIMAGINQVIMLALSMAVIAGMAGTDGLGKQVVESISTINVGLGAEAGLSVVILAIYLDRLTGAIGDSSSYKGSLRAMIAKTRTRTQAQRGMAGT